MLDVINKLAAALNDHDVERAAALFHADYRSEQPAHPARAFIGREQFHANWKAMFSGVPDFRTEIRRLAADGDTVWVEWSWSGTRTDARPFAMCGVCLFDIRDGLIAGGRLYMDEVEASDATIDEALRDLAGVQPRLLDRDDHGA